jgi:hypothetical protein
MRWSLLIADFNFTLIHKAGKIHLNADGLSRAPTSAMVADPEAPDIDNLSEGPDSSSGESEDSIENFDVDITREVNSVGSAWDNLKLECSKCKKPEIRKKLLICETCATMLHPHCAADVRPSTHYWHCENCRKRISETGAMDETEDE